jgi:CRISPR/Cas system endoribonuclease Cas6 (RAMP superfamily)
MRQLREVALEKYRKIYEGKLRKQVREALLKTYREWYRKVLEVYLRSSLAKLSWKSVWEQ